jgi:hypothetical protein
MSAKASIQLNKPGTIVVPSNPTAVIVYEDTPTGLRAVRALNELPPLPGRNDDFIRRFWRWDLLRSAWLSEQAAREAGEADVLLLSAHGDARFPFEVESWLRAWLLHRQSRARALGLLLDRQRTTSDSQNRILAFTRHIAECAGINLFYHFAGTAFGPTVPHCRLPNAHVTHERSTLH